MNGRERVLASIAGQPTTDGLPRMPITMMFAADRAGVRYGDYARDYRVMAEAQLRVAEEFDFDHVSAISDPAREAADCGAEVEWFDDQPPALNEERALLADKSGLARLPRFDTIAGRRMEDRVRAVELLRARVGADKFVEGWVEGPCAEGSDLRGINRLMIDFSDDPEFVRDLFARVVHNALAFARPQIEAGADIIGVGDAAASLVGPRIYEQFVWPFEKQLVDGIHALSGRVRLHICGNTRRILDGMGRLGCEIADIDYPAPLEEARAKTGPAQVLAGNLHPVKAIRDGTPESVRAGLGQCYAAAGPRYIVAAGCEIPRGTPPENVHAMVEFARASG
jgi:MtaA/CmuA family methyltransferase